MAYLGKLFKFEKEENFDAFINFLASSDENAKKFLSYKPNFQLDKNGDTYTLTTTGGDFKKEVSFKNGETFEEVVGHGIKTKTTVTIDGDTFTHVQDFGPKGKVSFRREYSANGIKVTATASNWDGSAYRYYVPA